MFKPNHYHKKKTAPPPAPPQAPPLAPPPASPLPPPQTKTSNLISNNQKKKELIQCNHCFRNDHLRKTSINCLRNKNNPNFVPINISIEPPALSLDQTCMLEYTVHTQNSIENDLHLSHQNNLSPNPTSLLTLETSDLNENTPRIRTPEQILNNRNIAKQNYQKKRNLNQHLDEQDQQKKYLKEFNCHANGPLHEQKWAKEKMKNFNIGMDEIKQYYCDNCHELWPSKLNYCLQCKIDKIKYSKANDMIPGIDELDFVQKKSFEDLTMIEEMLISPILVVMSVFRLPGGAIATKGFCANFSQNIQPIINILPRLPKDLPILI
ncbi:unnamed protein product [Brachionus calyciflorus]|uniref:DUF6570 domain-containing protein n=1 Tax=Brachionus calyciflorus TaxID=104777 RepID=A0A814K0N1_9BILA|nr:unnamed protein product [Brachionus calyciflorus]